MLRTSSPTRWRRPSASMMTPGEPSGPAQIGRYGAAQIYLASTIDMPLRHPGPPFLPGKYRFHDNRNRYYSIELVLIYKQDPAGLAGGINSYGYRTRPLKTVDIDGLGQTLLFDPAKGHTAHTVKCTLVCCTNRSEQGRPRPAQGKGRTHCRRRSMPPERWSPGPRTFL